MADVEKARGVSGEMELRYESRESGNYGQDDEGIRVTLHKHSETEVLMKVESWGGNHFPGKAHRSFVGVYVIDEKQLELFIEKNGRKLPDPSA